MTLPLTTDNPEFDRAVKRTPPGMAFWSGTCPDQTKTCGDCHHYRNLPRVLPDGFEVPSGIYGCDLYTKHTGRRRLLRKATVACKYFANTTQA